MPAVSKKQEKFMQAVAHNKGFAKKVGVPQSVGREFTKGSDMKGEHPVQKKAKSGAKMVKMAAGGKAYAKGGLAAGHKAADGIAKKGKTKARQVKMMGGGKC
jgi:hypothetical protein